MRSHGGGFTLIEVLVAVFVLAVGVLGALAAHTTAMRTRQASALMSNGVQLASSLAERMRANRAQMRLSDARNPYLALRFDGASDQAGPAPAACTRNACNSAELAQQDIAELKYLLSTGFPGARLAVCRDAVGWDPARRALGWDCTGGSFNPIVIKLGWRDGAPEVQPLVAIVLAGEGG